MSNFTKGANSGASVAAQSRRARQIELTNSIKGYDLQDDGTYKPNDIGKLKLSNDEESLIRELMATKIQNDAIASMLNATSMTDATTQIIMGDTKSARNIIKNNPLLAGKLQRNFGISDIAPIDWNNDIGLFDSTDIDITPDMVHDEKVMNALSSTFFKVRDVQGKEKLADVHTLMAQTNYGNYADSQTREVVDERVRKLGEILSMHIKTPEQREEERIKQQTSLNNARTSSDVDSLRNEAISEIMSSSASPEDKLSLISEINKAGVGDLSTKIQEQRLKIQEIKASVEGATASSKVAKATADAESARSKANKNYIDSQVASATAGDAASKIHSDAIVALKKANNGFNSGDASFIENITDVEKTPYNDENLEKAYRIQGDRKLTDGRNQEVSGRMSMARAFDSFTNRFRDMSFDKNAVTKLADVMDKLMKPGATGRERSEAVESIKAHTELYALVSEYVKFMSGAAVTNDEYNRYNDMVQAGVWADKDAALAALESFTGYLDSSAKRALDTIIDTPYDYLIKRNQYLGFDVGKKAAKSPSKPRDIFKKFEG